MLSNFIVSFLCIELSSGFMQSVIYILLYQNRFGPDFYALTFILTLLPSFLFGGKISNLLDGKKGKLIFQILSFIVIFIYITCFIAKGFTNIYVMLFLEAMSSLYAVSIYPYIQVFIKSLNLSRSEIVNFAKAESIVGPTSSVIGLGIGSICVTLNNISYFYLSSIIIISFGIINLNRVMIKYKKENDAYNYEISLDRKPHASIFIFLPALFSITTIPFIVVFPIVSIDKFAGMYENYLSPSALVLIARCLGQCLGPFLISNKITSIFFNNKFNIIIAQILFVLFYMCGYISINPFLVFLFIAIAHVIGSIVATICYVGIQKEYDNNEISYASALQIKYLILSSLILSLTSSRLYIFGGIRPIFFLSIVGIISLVLFFYANAISKNDD